MVYTVLKSRSYLAGLLLKIGVILSCAAGIYLQMADGKRLGSIFLYFTNQSNIWIAAICAVFLTADMLTKGNRNISRFLYVVKFMFTASIMLTFIVFSVLLSPLMTKSYLTSPSNICLHNLTPILAIIDFIVCDYGYESRKNHVLYATIMPILYTVSTFILSFEGVRFGGDIVPYFFLNYRKLGWVTVSKNGIGVVYWIIIITALILVMGIVLLTIKDLRRKKIRPAGMNGTQALLTCRQGPDACDGETGASRSE